MGVVGDFLRAIRGGESVTQDAPTISSEQARYLRLYYAWSGDFGHTQAVASQFLTDQKLYKNTRQLWRQMDAVVALYAQFVYAGNSLSAGSEPLGDGTKGAIPIDTAGLKEGEAKAIREAIDEWWRMVNYRQFKSLRPKFAAILGDVLTELVDDLETGAVRPRMVWPGHVVHLALDLAGNVKEYVLEYPVTVPENKYFGKNEQAKSYRYRKEVNGDYFRVFHDDKQVYEQENRYGFVPAVWDRHEIVLGDRGMSAIERTFQQSAELNSVLSHAMDYLQTNFGAPIGVKGTALSNRNPSAIAAMLNNRNSTGDPLADAALIAQSLNLLPMTDNGDFISAKFDIAQMPVLMEMMRDSLYAESPEGSFSQQILEMTQVTAPGVERALGPIIGRVKDVRANADTQTVKLIQMAISMTAARVLAGSYGKLLTTRKDRYDVFRPFGEGAFDAGKMDFTIPDREVIPDTIDERISRQMQIEQLQWPESLLIAGVDPDVVKRIDGERRKEQERQAKMDELAVVGVPADNGEED